MKPGDTFKIEHGNRVALIFKGQVFGMSVSPITGQPENMLMQAPGVFVGYLNDDDIIVERRKDATMAIIEIDSGGARGLMQFDLADVLITKVMDTSVTLAAGSGEN